MGARHAPAVVRFHGGKEADVSHISRLTGAIGRSPVLWGLAATAALYAVYLQGFIAAWFGAEAQAFLTRFIDSHPVEYVEVSMFFVGMAALLIRRGDIARQLRTLARPLLGPVPSEGHTSADCTPLLERLERHSTRVRQGYLAGRLHDALAYIRRKGTAEELDGHLQYLSELDEARAHRGYALVRVIIWAIPILGFLGTVIGITMAIAQLNPQQLEQSLDSVVTALAVAFDTTALALALSIVLMFTQFAVDRLEARLLAGVDRTVEDELSARFLQTGTGGHPEVAAVRRMSEAVLEATGQLVQQQAELWQRTIDEAHERWRAAMTTAHQEVESALGRAMNAALESHARHVAQSGEVLAEKNHDYWRKVEHALAENAQLVGQQQQQMTRQTEALRSLAGAASQVTQLEDALNRNLASLAGSGQLQGTLEGLAGVVLRLNDRLAQDNVTDQTSTDRAA